MASGDSVVSGRVFSYDRVSHSSQVAKGGLQRQSDMAADWCKRHGVELDTELVLSDPGRSAYSGSNLRRGALGQFIALAQQKQLGKNPVLLVEALDRLSRLEPLDALDDVLIELVKRCGVTVVVLEDGQTYSRASLTADPMALLKLAMQIQAAHQYSARLSRRLSTHWTQVRTAQDSGKKIVRGRGGMRPFWLDADQATDEWRLNDKAPAVSRLFELLLSEGLLSAADRLNAEGHPTPKGKPWDASAVRRVATDPSAKGDLVRFQTAHAQTTRAHRRWQEAKAEAEKLGKPFDLDEPEIRQLETVEGYYPAAVNQELWQQVQQAMANRDQSSGGNRGRTTGSLLQGLVQCEGGGAMGITSSLIRSSGEMRRYYACRRRRRREPCPCSGEHWRGDWVHGHVLSRLSDHLLQRAALPGEDQQAELRRVEQRLQSAQQQQREAADAVAKAEAMLEQAVDRGSLDLAENASALLEKRKQAQRKAAAETTALQQQVELTQARALPISALGNEAGSELLRAIAREEASDADRLRLRDVLRQSRLQVVLKGSGDDRQVGLRFGPGEELDWQPLDGVARTIAARMGAVQPVVTQTGDEKGGRISIHSSSDHLTPEQEAELQQLLSAPQPATQEEWLERMRQQRSSL